MIWDEQRPRTGIMQNYTKFLLLIVDDTSFVGVLYCDAPHKWWPAWPLLHPAASLHHLPFLCRARVASETRLLGQRWNGGRSQPKQKAEQKLRNQPSDVAHSWHAQQCPSTRSPLGVMVFVHDRILQRYTPPSVSAILTILKTICVVSMDQTYARHSAFICFIGYVHRF